jgi:Plasmid pRiA4b ORF-3-like protein
VPAVPQHYPVRLTQAQRKVVAEVAPELADRLKLGERNQRAIPFTPAELRAIKEKAGKALRQARTGMVRNSLRHVVDLTAQALDHCQGIGAIPAAERLYQFKITLLESHPPIWRRIQVKVGTLDKLHEHLQTALGWTNSHLHHFRIGEQLYGDPLLLGGNFDDMGYEDSTTTKVSAILPRGGRRFRFEYEYDFGDGWRHAVLFEGCLRAERGQRYPLCLEGARACPPEDVGGVWGYQEFLEAIADPDHEQHEEMLEWVGGQFDPEAFDPAAATRAMHRGLPDWRRLL